ncbi:MAG: hypothetical protein IJK98_03265 [Clostridia bacterium]|nr:hypothetical protein [Clostridia bacterium]
MNLREILRPTDDVNEMAEIGKQIWENDPATYNDRRRALLGSILDAEMPEASKEEKNTILYRSLYDYWMYGFSLKEEFSLRVFDMTHSEKQKYITFRGRFLFTSYLNEDNAAHFILWDKYQTYLHFREFFLRDVICIEKESDYEVFAEFAKTHPTFVVKPIDLAYGWGIHKQTVAPDADLKEAFLQILHEGDEIQKKHHTKQHTTKFVLEELIDQSDKLGCLHPHSVNCIRLTTVVAGGRVHFFYPRIKIGRHGNFISNAGDDGLLAGIDLATGRIETYASDEFGHDFDVHPDTGIRFNGFQIPDWEDLLRLGEKVALALAPKINYVGWDMAYTNAGWSILEGNAEGEFGAQFIYKKGLKEEFEELIGWKPPVEYWWDDPVATKIG